MATVTSHPDSCAAIWPSAGDAQNRLETAVQRTVPFMMPNLTILICWYTRYGDAEHDLTQRHDYGQGPR